MRGVKDDFERDLQAALATRPVIERAKGVIIHGRRATPEQAHAELRFVSQKHNVRVNRLAVALVDAATGVRPDDAELRTVLWEEWGVTCFPRARVDLPSHRTHEESLVPEKHPGNRLKSWCAGEAMAHRSVHPVRWAPHRIHRRVGPRGGGRACWTSVLRRRHDRQQRSGPGGRNPAGGDGFHGRAAE